MRLHPIPVTPLYPVHPWQIVETAEARGQTARNATIFALANGTLGVRGAPENGHGDTAGTYINGFYETTRIQYPEVAYGYPVNNQTMLNVADATGLRLQINGEWLKDEHIIAHQRTLDLRTGIVTTEQTLEVNGQTLHFVAERLVSLRQEAIFAQSFRLTSQDFSGTVAIHSWVNADTRLKRAGRDPRIGSHLQGQVFDIQKNRLDKNGIAFTQATRRSNMALACAVLHTVTPETLPRRDSDNPYEEKFVYQFALVPESVVRVEKMAAYLTTQRYQRAALVTLASEQVRAAIRTGFRELARDQHALLTAFWDTADVELDGDDAIQQGIRFNLFHVFQSVGRDGQTSVAAKGLTGAGYEGHYFWDTEMYVIPALVHTMPQVVRQLLTFRYTTLDAARQRARELGHRNGASFPWRTINGNETSTYFPAGSAQYHINSAVAYAVQQYYMVTGDDDFMTQMGVEILLETARLWAELGSFIPGRGFCICEVTGPDEYTALVDNNAYTNWMAQANLRAAVKAVMAMRTRTPETFATLSARVRLEDSELIAWQQAADGMFVRYDETLKLYPQDDSFFNKPSWDFEATPASNYPLMLHYHPLVIYRHQVCKQADLVLAMYLLGDQFTAEEKKRHFDYYEAITTHDSSLSACIFSLVASDIGDDATAYDYFMATARMDLDDLKHNIAAGVHIANMAGTSMCIVNGFGGMHVFQDELHLRPTLPVQWSRVRFNVLFHGVRLRVEVTRECVTYTLVQGETLTFLHDRVPVTVQARQPLMLATVAG